MVENGNVARNDSGSSAIAGLTSSPKSGLETAGDLVVSLSGAVSLIDRFPALAGVDLEIRHGEVVFLRGANGAGKSTLLRLCAGLAPLSQGSGTILGSSLKTSVGRRKIRRETGLLAHQTFLYDELTVDENLKFWAKANRVLPETIDPVLDRIQLDGRLRKVKAGRLSAGQRRRASFAIMVCRRPKLWLLDEPHAGLDKPGREFVDSLIATATSFGATVLIASHEIERVSEFASRVVEINAGTMSIEQPEVHTASGSDPNATSDKKIGQVR